MTHTKTVLRALPAIPGATHHEIAAATGMKETAVQRALDRLKPAGLVAYAKVGRINYYYADQAAKDADEYALMERCAKASAAAKAETKRKDMARQLARYHNKKKLSGEKRGPKPIKLIQPKPVNREAAARLKFSAQEAIKPASVKVQQCPGFTGRHRFEADPKCYGAGFQAEWAQKRGAA